MLKTNDIINKYGKVIVLEDDLVSTSSFLEFMNEGLQFYENNKQIWQITGYNYPIKISENYDKDIY